jgi:broad specificity phosphatase PhoE
VTHGGPIRALVAYASGLGYGESRRTLTIVENCGVVRVEVEGSRVRLVD